jgi:MFS family permease
MSDTESNNETASDSTPVPTCPLSLGQQNQNLLLFASCTGLLYLAAPVLYIGVTQASLCAQLGAKARTANLPATLFFAMTAAPALIAWAFPYVSYLRRNLVACYSITGCMLALMAVALIVPISNDVRIAFVILQGAVSGACMPAAIAFMWEAVGRGTEASRRGLALSLAFGAGPVLAVVGSLCSQLLLSGQLGPWKIEWLKYPWNFASLFGAGVPVMALAAFLASRFIVPPAKAKEAREPFGKVADLCAGIAIGLVALLLYEMEFDLVGHVLLAVAGLLFIHHFRDILSQKQLLLATIVTVMLYSGNTIPSNMNLYTKEALRVETTAVPGESQVEQETDSTDDLPAKYAGYQNTLRFSFKVVTGFLLGWMLTKTNPRAGILMTGGIFIAAQVWAILATGTAYLIAFGLYGAGELVGVYAPNYILSASRESQIRRNMAFVTMLMVPAAPTGYLFGAIADYITDHDIIAFGATSSRAFGFQASFAVCASLMTLGLILAICLLPARPKQEA